MFVFLTGNDSRLNKINYIQDRQENLNVQYDVSITIYAAVDKFKVSRPDVEFVLDIDKKKIVLNTPLSSLGFYDVEIQLHKTVVATIKVQLVGEK